MKNKVKSKLRTCFIDLLHGKSDGAGQDLLVKVHLQLQINVVGLHQIGPVVRGLSIIISPFEIYGKKNLYNSVFRSVVEIEKVDFHSISDSEFWIS